MTLMQGKNISASEALLCKEGAFQGARANVGALAYAVSKASGQLVLFPKEAN